MVHHKDGNHNNNSINNLELTNAKDHMVYHAKLRSMQSRRFKTRNVLFRIGIGDSQIDEILSGVVDT